MKKDEWRDVPGFEGFYQASSFGHVRSLDRTYEKKNRWGQVRMIRIRGRTLKPWVGSSGYCVVYFAVKEMECRRAVQVHQAVASAFLPPSNGFQEINHIDGRKLNNAPENLEWCTRKENVAHARRIGLIKASRPVIATPKKNGGTPLHFFSPNAAAIGMGGIGKRGNIASALVGFIPSAYGYRWRYAIE